MRYSALIPAAALGLSAASALAAPTCVPPPNLQPAPALAPRPEEVVRGVAIVSYVLALSWTPEWCRSGGSGAGAKEMECAMALGFKLHGLWPDGERPPYPRYCRPGAALDLATLRQMYCRTPSAVLLQHEWQAHGTCAGWKTPQDYFTQASRLFDQVRLPAIEHLRPGNLDAGALRAAFVLRNPWLKADEVYVQTNRAGALTEVRICYDLNFKPSACPSGNGAPDGARLELAPSRSGAF